MWSKSVVVVSALFVVACSGDGGGGAASSHNSYDAPSAGAAYPPANYAYQYAVKDDYFGVDFKADESRADEKTAGSYEVLLPDGRVQTVVYKVNGYEGGYEAEVSYNGEPVYPAAAPVEPLPYSTGKPAAAAAAAAPVKATVPSYTPAPAPQVTSYATEPTPTKSAAAAAPAPAAGGGYRPVVPRGPAYSSSPENVYSAVAPASSYRHYSPLRASTGVYRSKLSYNAGQPQAPR